MKSLTHVLAVSCQGLGFMDVPWMLEEPAPGSQRKSVVTHGTRSGTGFLHALASLLTPSPRGALLVCQVVSKPALCLGKKVPHTLGLFAANTAREAVCRVPRSFHSWQSQQEPLRKVLLPALVRVGQRV